jgi:uncharacterized membrane protein YhaH (DUF805 family)
MNLLGRRPSAPHCQEVQLITDGDRPSSTTKEIELSQGPSLLSFQGRIGRGTFWFVWLSMMGLSLIVAFLCGVISAASEGGQAVGLVIFVLWAIPLSWILLAMQVKRWHDMNLTGWMVLINAIPIVGPLFSLISFGFIKGNVGSNNYGSDPLQRRHS